MKDMAGLMAAYMRAIAINWLIQYLKEGLGCEHETHDMISQERFSYDYNI